MNFTKKLRSYHPSPLGRVAVIGGLALVVAVPMFAQSSGSPFDAPLTAAQAFALNFARVAAVIALIWGFVQMAFGDGHRAGGLMSILFGVGGMAYAQKVVLWLFP